MSNTTSLKSAKTARVARRPSARRWSADVTQSSNALDLEDHVFTKSPRQMALSLKRSAEQSRRRKSSPFRSAMSMITFYENRAGRNLSLARKRAIRQAKIELRRLYGKTAARQGR